MTDAKCAIPGCEYRPDKGSRLCYIHQDWTPPHQPAPHDDWEPDDNAAPDAPPQSRAEKRAPKAPAPPKLQNVSTLFAPAIERGRLRQKGVELPVPTPWRELNDTLGGGMWPGLHMLVAGTGVGKTQLCMQIASHAVTRPSPIPVGLIELELDEMQLALRILGDHAHVSWSGAYLGKIHDDSYAKLDASAALLSSLPMYCDFGDAMSWGPSRLVAMAQGMRAAHPTGPLLLVLDFLQLVGPDSPEDGRLDLRERIGRAAYAARMVARKYGASVLLVSSTARDNYGTLSGKMDKTGLRCQRSGLFSKRVVTNPDALIGTGKESGELEYAADSLTVLIRPQLTLGDNHQEIDQLLAREGRPIVAATVKVRAGAPSWMALGFEKGVFSSLSPEAMNSLGGERDAEKEPESTADELVAQVVALARDMQASGAPICKRTTFAEMIRGRKADVLDAVKTALRTGQIQTGVDGFFRARENAVV